MEDQKKELNTDTLEEVSGGSFVHTEASIRGGPASICCWMTEKPPGNSAISRTPVIIISKERN